MNEPIEHGRLLEELEELPEDARAAHLLERAGALEGRDRAELLGALLSSPSREHRELAAEVANTLGVDPLAELDDGPTEEILEEEAALLRLGFDDEDEDELAAAPPRPAPRGPDVVILDDEPTRSGAGRARALGLVLLGLVAAAGFSALNPGSAQLAAEQAERCWQNRQVLEAAAARFEADTRPGSLADSPFLSGQGFQDALVEQGYLEEALRCPIEGTTRAYSYEPAGRFHVRCRAHGKARP